MPRGRKKQIDPQGWKAEGEQTDQRITNQDGSGSMAVAPRAEPQPIVLPPAEDALAVLGKLAIQNQQVEVAKQRYDEAASLAKSRKATWETEASLLSSMLSEATHAKPLPLFDTVQSEEELLRMEAAIDAARAAEETPVGADVVL